METNRKLYALSVVVYKDKNDTIQIINEVSYQLAHSAYQATGIAYFHYTSMYPASEGYSSPTISIVEIPIGLMQRVVDHA